MENEKIWYSGKGENEGKIQRKMRLQSGGISKCQFYRCYYYLFYFFKSEREKNKIIWFIFIRIYFQWKNKESSGDWMEVRKIVSLARSDIEWPSKSGSKFWGTGTFVMFYVLVAPSINYNDREHLQNRAIMNYILSHDCIISTVTSLNSIQFENSWMRQKLRDTRGEGRFHNENRQDCGMAFSSIVIDLKKSTWM